MAELVIIHFAPLEFYPPIQNLIRTLERESPQLKVSILTTKGTDKGLTTFKTQNQNFRIIRMGQSGAGGMASRYLNYLKFYLFSIFLLVKLRPAKILYFETLSSFPVFIYKKLVGKKLQVYIHYHEYTSPAEYKNGMALTRFFHRMEKQMYADVSWISHTNPKRMELFEKDVSPIKLANPRILPNYPPQDWRTEPHEYKEPPYRVVYAGALSLDTMYAKEFAEWVSDQKGKVTWDIYSYNYTQDAAKFFRSIDSQFINLYDGVDYDRLPGILREYHMGVILYKGHIQNYIHNAPNKLFEYLICGLDVIFPSEMVGCLPYQTSDSRPQVLCVNFNEMYNFNISEVIRNRESEHRTSVYDDSILSVLVRELI